MLAIQTTSETLSLALKIGESLFTSELITPRETLTSLAPALKRLGEEAGCELGEVESLAVCIGPGSFTGIRIGVATAKALSQALGLPCYGIPSLLALAWAVEDKAGEVLCVLPAFASEYYLATYSAESSGWCQTSPVEGLPLEELTLRLAEARAKGVRLVTIGTAAGRALAALESEALLLPEGYPLAVHILTSAEKILAGAPEPAGFRDCAPIYVYRSQAERALGLAVD